MGDETINTTPIFLGGAPRSGLTLLGAMLGTHSHIFCGPDLNLMPTLTLQWNDFRDALGDLHENHFALSPTDVQNNFAALINGLFENALEKSGRKRIVEKSAVNALVFKQLRELFPHSPRIHVLRDGRDVVASLLQTGWTNPQTGDPLPYTHSAAAAARYWVQYVEAVQATVTGDRTTNPVIEVRYEDLVTDAQSVLSRICNAIDEDFEPGLLDYGQRQNRRRNLAHSSFHSLKKKPHERSMGAWKKSLDLHQRNHVKEVAGSLLIELGYCKNLDW